MISWCYTCFRLLKALEKLTKWVEISRFSFHTLENVALSSESYEKGYNEKGSQTRAGAWVVLIFGPNLKLAVLIKLVLIKKACILKQHLV